MAITTLSGVLEGCSVYLAFDKLLPMPTSDGREKFSLDPKPEPMFSFGWVASQWQSQDLITVPHECMNSVD